MSSQQFTVVVSAIACGWPVFPIAGALIRRTLNSLLIDSAIGVTVGGVVFLVLSSNYRWLLPDTSNERRQNAWSVPMRLALAGATMVAFGMLGLIFEWLARGAT